MQKSYPIGRKNHVIGTWMSRGSAATRSPADIADALQRIDHPLYIIEDEEGPGVAEGGCAFIGEDANEEGYPLLGYVAPTHPARLGESAFCAEHGVAYPYVAGAMANGIASEDLVVAMGRAGMLAFFGAAGLPIERVDAAIKNISSALPEGPFGINLIHSPNESNLEEALVDLFLKRGIQCIEASAYLKLTPAVVRYRVSGIRREADGSVTVPNRIMAKISRIEVATKFLSPPPEKILRKLLESGGISEEEAKLAEEISMADDLTAEADSGGHTDNRPAVALLPTMCALRDRLQQQFAYTRPPRVGLGGGMATPASLAAAFSMGAAYVVTGSINQACVESGSSDLVRDMLAQAQQADTAMAPAADMFEMGVQVQVLKRGTMFAMRAKKLYELYRAHESIDAIPEDERTKLEKTVFRATLDEIWTETRRFFTERDPRQVERAEKDPRHKMSLVFRWYLGQSSSWANAGLSDRKMDFQVWCGPAMGAFNEWTKGSFLEDPGARKVETVALNLLYGAAVVCRANALRQQGFELAPDALAPQELDEIRARMQLRPSAVGLGT